MIIKTHHTFLLLILSLMVSMPSYSQKKKKGTEDVHAADTRSREAEFFFTEGEKFFILEDYTKALSYYQRTLDLTPQNATVHYKIAEVHVQSSKAEDLQKAALSIDNALRLEKRNKYFYLLGANIYSSLGQFDKAAQIYETMLAQVPATEEYFYELAAVYKFAGRPDDALKTYQRAEVALGVNEVSSLQKQSIYLEQGKTKEALAEGEKLLKAFPSDEKYVMSFTEILSEKGMKNEAVQYLSQFVNENPDALNTKMLLAALYRDTKQEEKARGILTSLFDHPEVELNSKFLIIGAYNAELNYDKSKNIVDKDKQSFVGELVRKLQSAHPDNATVHVISGDYYLSTGNNREAQSEYLKAVRTGEVNFEVWQNLLYLDHQMGQYDLMLDHSDEALELFPNQGLLHYFNGQAHLRKKNYREAVAAFLQAKRLSSSNTGLTGELNALLGEAYHGLNDHEKSDQAFEEALASNPENDNVLNNYSYYLALRKTNLEKAERMSSTLIKNHPDNAVYLDTHAWVLFARGKYKDAKKYMEKIVESGKANATQHEHYGDILYRLGDVDGAVMQWEKARSMNSKNENLSRKIANRKIYE